MYYKQHYTIQYEKLERAFIEAYTPSISLHRISCIKGTFTIRLSSARLMTVTGNFRLPIGRLKQSTNRQSKFTSHSHGSRILIVKVPFGVSHCNKNCISVVTIFLHCNKN